MKQEPYEIVTTSAGALSIRDNAVGEIMHNPVGPWVEANELYIKQSHLKRRLTDCPASDYIIFDIGLGAATNALAVIHCLRDLIAVSHPTMTSPSLPTVKLISFERNLELLKFARLHADRFDHFQGFENAVDQLLLYHRWDEPSLTWELRHEDFLQSIEKEWERPHLIFFDAYSPKVNSEMWTLSVFKKLYARSRDTSEGGTRFFTYSQATRIRAALLAAGFYVGHGPGTGLKEETTQAATELQELSTPLGPRWLKRWKASQNPYPFHLPKSDEDSFRQIILSHRQFAM